MSLRDNAAVLAGRNGSALEPTSEPLPDFADPTFASRMSQAEALPDFDEFEPGEGDPEQVPVHVAWNRLMRDVRKIGKAGTFEAEYGKKQTWKYRGTDQVVNEFGPAQRKHGLVIAPIRIEPTYGTSTSKGGSTARECTLIITWAVMGPAGDLLPFNPVSAAEAMDYSDRATTKAQSVALRTLLTVLAMVPTGDPDAESAYIERGEQVVRSPQDYLAEILNESTSGQRMWQIKQELFATKQAGALVPNEHGQNEAIGALVTRIGRERFEPKPTGPVCPRCELPVHNPDACPTLDGPTS
jgi:hypothetical protein